MNIRSIFPRAGSQATTNALVLLAAAVAVAVAVIVLCWSLGRPPIDQHSFRQAQTAIAAYWMLHGGPWIDYWLPVFGPPWSAPFEFPLYQWLVACLSGVTGVAVTDSGRIISFAWLLLAIVPSRKLLQNLKLPDAASFFPLLFLASPIYLFWGRAVLIETQAVCLSVTFLYFANRTIVSPEPRNMALALVAGIAAALTKITTIGPFVVAAGMLLLAHLSTLRAGESRLALMARVAIVSLPGPILAIVWNAHADALKSKNILAELTRSVHLTAWNFGTVGQRFSIPFVRANLRAVVDTLGWGAVLLVPVTFALMLLFARKTRDRRSAKIVALALVLYFIPWMVLTNLHIIHNYYQTANAIFLIGAVAIALGSIAGADGRKLALALALGFVVSQYATFATRFAPSIAEPQEAQREMALAKIVGDKTSASGIVLTYGLDWSPVLAYEAKRKAIMEPKWTTPAQFRSRLGFVDANLDGSAIEAIVRCPSQVDGDPVAEAKFAQLKPWDDAQVAGCRVLFVGAHEPPPEVARDPR